MICLDGKVRRPKMEIVLPEAIRIGDCLPGYGGSIWTVRNIDRTTSGGWRLNIGLLGRLWSNNTYPRSPQRRLTGWAVR